jgi:hypothetical protein
MRWCLAAVFGVALALPAYADMYQDASNAVQPKALNNLGKAAGSFFAPAYGNCTWDATHDVGPCINAALTAAAQAGGGTVNLPPGALGLATKVVWPQTGQPIALRCPSGGGSGATATTLKWIGAVAGRMVEIRTDNGSVKGSEITQCGFDGNAGLAADGLYLSSVDHGHFDDLSFVGGFNGGNVVNLTVDSPPPAQGSQNNTFDNLFVANGVGGVYTSNQLRLGTYIRASDGVHGNAAFNVARNIVIGGNGGTAIICEGCDNNYISGRVFHNGTSIDLTVATAGSQMFPANGNVFSPMYYSGTFIARGQTSFPSCTPFPTCTYNNFVSIDETNATPAPTIEPGAGLQWASNSGYTVGAQFYGVSAKRSGLIAAQDLTLRGSCPANAASYGTSATTYLCNSENTPYVFFDDAGGNRFEISNTGSGTAKNLRFNKTAGTGLFQFGETVEFDNGILPAVYGGGNLGSAILPFSGLYANSWVSSNTAHTWLFSLGLVAGSADADAILEKDGTRVMTFNPFVTTIEHPATPQRTMVQGSGCAVGMFTADANYIYFCTAANTWKRAALTAY